ncbi:diaminopimelate epimerase [Oceanobacillus oncorhynchi subsp. incaldanensis]|uniref:Diaminopimelate epimerase n=1 Tax=Oceanobacillus aidingensis TaxID=645964 RepID=A0ABV9JZN4_9BACI|nr:diaminopimelate epimerase [Oceanobacillus oncorhynchi]MDM8098507.1 diaminopimelate epimerase [Oceanobacillus oncorhynchi]UUI38968.1 diaminopimelate epimerase [Oceanobacillus oncorhynchi]GIO19243.1 diaminopimelate epimerase [Oceanobacillus oncorhynchi subsp. incaldanensis]
MKIPFTKMHGLGNNYIYIDLFQTELPENRLSELAINMSNQNTGIGSDGMILIHPAEKADVGMRIFNKDGSEGMNCGNGLRCTAKYAYETGIVDKKEFTIQTKANIVRATVKENDEQKVNEVTIDMGAPILQREQIPMLGEAGTTVINEPFEVADKTLHVTAVSMGNPHVITMVDAIDDAPLTTLGPVIEKDERFPEGVNTEFIEVVSDEEIHFRVWERGSGVTEACGTGACAAVVAATLNKKVTKGKKIVVHLAGGDLIIEWRKDDHIWMTGGAETIATGIFYA